MECKYDVRLRITTNENSCDEESDIKYFLERILQPYYSKCVVKNVSWDTDTDHLD